MREISPQVWEVGPSDVALPRRDREAHKGKFGKVCILGGAVGYTGAPVLAARAAMRTGSGLVSVLVPEPIYPTVATHLTCSMPWPLPADTGGGAGQWNGLETLSMVALGLKKGTFSKEALDPALKRMEGADTALVGPGLSRSPAAAWLARKLIEKLDCPLVVDADGINALSGHIDVLDKRTILTVLTPHEREFIRLGVEISPDRVAAARNFAVAHGCVLVLKGHRTVTAFPDGDAFVNTTGNPGMAKGGSGDALAGMILSLLGQGIDPKRAVPWAVCLHGLAGDLAAEELGEYGMTPMDLIEKIPQTMKKF